jgi:hypothetical protein
MYQVTLASALPEQIVGSLCEIFPTYERNYPMPLTRHINVEFRWTSAGEGVPDWMQKEELFLEDAIVRILVKALEDALKGTVTDMHARLVPFLLYQE